MHLDGLFALNQALFCKDCMAQPTRCRVLEEPLCRPAVAVRVRRLLHQQYQTQAVNDAYDAYDDDDDDEDEVADADDSDDEDEEDGLEPFRGVPARQQVTARMRAGLVGTPGLPSSGEPAEVAPGVFASGSKWARDHEWAAAHNVTTMVDVGCFTWARGRPATRARFRIPLEDPDQPLPRCSLHFAYEDVRDLAACMRQAHAGFVTVGGRHAPREQPGAVLVYCSTGQVARLAAVAALLLNSRADAQGVCAKGWCRVPSTTRQDEGGVHVCPRPKSAVEAGHAVPHVHVLPVR
jgi:hypothetical protein